jgi:glycosyl transferase family 25
MYKSSDVKAIVIALPRFRERYVHITAHARERFGSRFAVVGVDGLEVDPSRVVNEVLTTGQVGCALAHQAAYRLMVERDLPSALVIEDDVVLPEGIEALVDELRGLVGHDEVIQLYNWPPEPSEFSQVGAERVAGGALHYPLTVEGLGAASAYVIGRGAAEAILRVNDPVAVAADNWTHFHGAGAVGSVRVVLPQPVSLRAFETTVVPREAGPGLSAVVARLKRVSLVRSALDARRRRLIAKRGANVILTDRPSPLALRQSGTTA